MKIFTKHVSARVTAISIGLSLAMVLTVAGFVLPSSVSANASYATGYCTLNNTAYNATNSVAYISAGKATSTLSCDLANLNPLGGNGGAAIPDTAALALQFAASSTATILNANVEYSFDNVDWYQDTLSDRSTTTPAFNFGPVQTYSGQFSSSTAGLGPVPVSNATTTRMLNIKTPTRYVRVVFTVPAGSAGAAVWAEIGGKKQAP